MYSIVGRNMLTLQTTGNMRKLFWSIIIGVCSIACSCADDMPEEFDSPVKGYANISMADTSKVDTTIVSSKVLNDLRSLYNETWKLILENNYNSGEFKYETDPDIEDMVAFLKWVLTIDEYDWMRDSCYFYDFTNGDPDVASVFLGFTKIKVDSHWELFKEEE